MQTRGTRGRAYTLLTPENRYVSRLPSLPGVSCYKLVTPRLAPARLGQYLLGLGPEPVSCQVAPGFENFLFGLDGSAHVSWDGGSASLGARAYVYLPAAAGWVLESGGAGQVLWIKRRYEPWPGLEAPAPFAGDAEEIVAQETVTPGLLRRELVDPTDPRFDFNMSVMAFAPGVGLPFVEIHDEEHGLYMTAGAGSYVLGGDAHPVSAHDFIYMAPYCPQWFQAGETGAEYLLYKDVYRDGF